MKMRDMVLNVPGTIQMNSRQICHGKLNEHDGSSKL